MKTIRLVLLFTIFVTPSLFGFDLDVNHWSDYSGNIEGKPVSMSLYRFSNNQVRGHYYFTGNDNKIYLAGKIKGAEITLWAIVNKKSQAMIRGSFFTDSIDKFEGIWIEKSSRKIQFKLHLNAVTGESYKKRYDFLDGTTKQVEQFAKQVKLAIVSGDKEWLSLNINFPIKTSLDGKKLITINNQKQFNTNFNRIFHAAFVEKAKSFEYFDLFSNYQGVMMGAGEIWINSVTTSAYKNSKYKITAINN